MSDRAMYVLSALHIQRAFILLAACQLIASICYANLLSLSGIYLSVFCYALIQAVESSSTSIL